MRYIVSLKKFFKDQDGASMAEYAVLLAIMTATVAGSFTLMGSAVENVVTRTTGYIK